MNYRNSQALKIGVCFLSFIMMIAFLSGCLKASTAVEGWKAGLEKKESAAMTHITGIVVEDDSESIHVIVRADQKLTYTSVKQPSPPAVVLYFPKTALALENTDTDFIKTSEIIEAINTSEQQQNGGSSRIEILLNRDSDYDVSRQDKGLSISFPKASMTVSDEKTSADEEQSAETSDPVEAATVLSSIEAESVENGVKIFVKADGMIKDYKTFTISNPARIVFDIFNIKYELNKEQKLAVNSRWIKTARYYGHPDRVRLVLDTMDAYISDYSVTPVKEGLLITVGGGSGDTAEQEEVSGEKARKSAAVMNHKGPAWVNRLDFSSGEKGKSTIIIGTTFPVKYEVDKPVEKKLQIKLFDTNIPDYRKRPLITTRFESAVDRIIPVQIPAMKSYSIISIELRETVPYLIEQTDNLLMLHFEASTVPPKTMEEAKFPAWKKVIAETVADQDLSDVAAMEKPVGGGGNGNSASLTGKSGYGTDR